jgi:hypothetical protein
MKLLKPILIVSSTFLISGCCTCFPQTHTYDKDIVFVQGKPYLIPHGAEFTNIPVSSEITVKDYRLAGEECHKGYITWTSPKAAKELKETYRVNGADSFSYAYQKAIRDRKMGCSKPLSHSEYEYYKAQYSL